MDASNAPNVTSLVAILFAGAVAGLVSFFEKRRVKPAVDPSAKTGEVVAASIIDTRMVQGVSDSLHKVERRVTLFMEQQHDDSRALRLAIENMTDELRRNTEAQEGGAVTPRELAGLLGQIKRAGEP